MARRASLTFPANIKKIGNGFFLPLPSDYMDKLQLGAGDDVDVTVSLPEAIE